MEITTYKQNTCVPAYLQGATRKNTVSAIGNVILIEAKYTNLLQEEKEALVRYLHSNTQPMKDFTVDIKHYFTIKLHIYLTINLGFNLRKLEDKELHNQLTTVIRKCGEAYPDFGLCEIFDAIDYCLANKPELCKSYDSKEGQSSFTSAWLSQILNYYNTNAPSFRTIVGRLLAPIEKELNEKESAKQSNLLKIRIHRDIAAMILQNVNYWINAKTFMYDAGMVINEKTYLEHIYDNMIYLGFVLPSAPGPTHPYLDVWYMWKNKADANGVQLSMSEKIAGSKKQIITESFAKICPEKLIETETEWIGSYEDSFFKLAKSLGFFADVPELDLSAEMTIAEILEKYGNCIVSIYPLQDFELRINKKVDGGVGSVMRQKFDKIVAV